MLTQIVGEWHLWMHALSMAEMAFIMDKTYQGVVVHLNAHRKTLEKLGLNSVSSEYHIWGLRTHTTIILQTDALSHSCEYTCRQFSCGFKQFSDAQVYSVVQCTKEIPHAQEGVAQTTHHNRHTHPRHTRLYNHACIQAGAPVIR